MSNKPTGKGIIGIRLSKKPSSKELKKKERAVEEGKTTKKKPS